MDKLGYRVQMGSVEGDFDTLEEATAFVAALKLAMPDQTVNIITLPDETSVEYPEKR